MNKHNPIVQQQNLGWTISYAKAIGLIKSQLKSVMTRDYHQYNRSEMHPFMGIIIVTATLSLPFLYDGI